MLEGQMCVLGLETDSLLDQNWANVSFSICCNKGRILCLKFLTIRAESEVCSQCEKEQCFNSHYLQRSHKFASTSRLVVYSEEESLNPRWGLNIGIVYLKQQLYKVFFPWTDNKSTILKNITWSIPITLDEEEKGEEEEQE